ncbi:gamma-glutamyltransferase [Flavobacterium sp. MAH-1]|uniref:Glutathione hydrolase proenzyme n=1 Tax=Flavobacterium agri TaxID=2743471 RepID=A0A7Y9C603_9FLAO|nr:gamma-glutamyltransferase [Flavobacterium agri]NUY79863.1 gamma-glutamyltransferase [Flavobacterium agri]NYA69888.1 gamma-glutamyltransferase [Flavobacterium agri]
MRRFSLLLLLFSCQLSLAQVTAKKAMVVSAKKEASDIGLQIIRQGGNAFDAMIATQLALAIAYPYAGNISGGGFMVYRKANGEKGTLDFRETAPKASSKDMFLDKDRNVIPGKSTETALAVGVPGSIAAIYDIHAKFGSLPMKKLFEPAIALAEKGIVLSEKDIRHIENNQKDIIRLNGINTIYAKSYKIGDTIRFPALAETLKRISKNGRNEFYKGETAKKLIAYLKAKGGIMTLSDLESYKSKWRRPIEFYYKKLHVTTMAPPSSGGICLGQILKMIESYDVKSLGHNSEQYIQLLTEAERRSYADRNHFLGDPDFTNVPKNQLFDKNYLKQRMSGFSFEKATKSSDVSHGEIAFSESDETTHFSIVDSFGNAVSVTTTLNGAYGSKLYCDELGFFLNNEMDDFSAKPGVPNYFGLTGSEANSIAPGKRMLSSMTPTIVEKDGKLFMVLGTPGGSTIITSVLQTILNVTEFGMGMQQAVEAKRFHHQWLPDSVMIEPGTLSSEQITNLEAKGYKIDEKYAPVIGKVDAILIRKDGTKEAGADKRGDDAASGF